MTNRFPKEKFEQVAAENGYEVFTPEQIASYYKEGIEKSMNDQMSEAEKKEFVTDCMYLSKAVLVDKDGSESTVYFRKSQVDWEKSEDGTIMKGVAGVYADTPANRLLGRVGEAYIPDADFMKSLDSEENEIAKAARTGRYADTSENRRLHRVGQPYKKREGKGDQKEDESSRRVGTDNTPKNGVYLYSIRKDGSKYAKPSFYKFHGNEKTAEDVIARLEGLNPGKKFVKEEGSDKKLPEGWKKSIRVVDDEDSWNAALEDAMGSKEYNKVFTEDLAQDEDKWFKKMEEMIPKYMSPKQVQTLIDEVGTETEDDD